MGDFLISLRGDDVYDVFRSNSNSHTDSRMDGSAVNGWPRYLMIARKNSHESEIICRSDPSIPTSRAHDARNS